MPHTKQPKNTVILNLIQNLSNKKSKTYLGFTLVELIVVIVILAILATIAFLSFNSYSSSSRDSVRLSDINSLNKSLELFNVNASKYPDPTNVYTRVVYSGGVVFEQGNVGDSVFRAIQKINKKPIDPLDNSEYTYSTNLLRTSYQLKGELENKLSTGFHPVDNNINNNLNNINNINNNINNNIIKNGKYEIENIFDIDSNTNIKNIFNQVNADSSTGSKICYVKGNFNGLIEKTNTGNTNYILAVPGLIVNEKNNPGLDYNTLSGKVVCNGMNNPCIISYTPTVVFVGSGNSVPTTSEDIEDIMDKLKVAYSGSNTSTSTNPAISNLLNSTGSDLVSLGSSLVSKIGVGGVGGVVVNNSPVPVNSCSGSISDSNGISTATGEISGVSWYYSETPGICSWNCKSGYGWDGGSCEYDYFLGEDGVISSDDCNTKNIIICSQGSGSTICNPGTNRQVWSACNLGAKIAYTPATPNSGTFNPEGSTTRGGNDSVNGKIYQWGRNKGFYSNDTSRLSTQLSSNPNGTDSYNYIRNSTFRDWLSVGIDDLWGGNASDSGTIDGQTDAIPRKGPCPIGWHVPSVKDWQDSCNSITNGTCSNGMSNTGSFRNTLLLPYAGGRHKDYGWYFYQGTYGYYWASSPYIAMPGTGYNMMFTSSNVSAATGYSRAYGMSIRCLKNN